MVVAVAASPTPGVGAVSPLSGRSRNHPPYKDMILSAIKALKDRSGSSRRAISKFIADNYTGLPPTHSALLTLHLRRLRSIGVIRMSKLSYKIAAVPVARAAEGSKKRGRPPKAAQSGDDSAPHRRSERPPKLNADAGLTTRQKRKPGRPLKSAARAVPASVYILPKAERLNSGLFRSLPGATAIVMPKGILSENKGNSLVLILPNGIQPLNAPSAVNGKLGRPIEVQMQKKPGRPPKFGKMSLGRRRKEAALQDQEVGHHGTEHKNLIARKPGRPRKIKDLLQPENGQLLPANVGISTVVEKIEPARRPLVHAKQKNKSLELKKTTVGRPRKRPIV